MADFEKKVGLIEIEIDNAAATKQVDKLSSAIIEQGDAVKDNNAEIKNLNKTNKDLEKQVKEGTITQEAASAAIVENNKKVDVLKKANFSLKDGIKDLNKERSTAVTATKLQSNSLDALRKKVISQKKELNGLNTATVEGKKRFEELTKSLKENNESITSLDQAAGDYKTSVGQYSQGVIDAFDKTGLLSGAIAKTQMVQEKAREGMALYKASMIGASAGSGGLSGALGILRLALISSGFGAIVVLLGSFVTWLSTTQAGIDLVTAAFRPLQAAVQAGIGYFQKIGAILMGESTEGMESFTDAMKRGIETGKQLDTLQKDIEKNEIELIKSRAKLNVEFEKYKSIAEDVNRSDADRIKAAQDAQSAQNKLLDMEQKFLDMKIEKMELEHTLNDTLREDDKELAELIAQRTEFEAGAIGKKVSIRNLENSIAAGMVKDEKARYDERIKNQKAFNEQSKIIEMDAVESKTEAKVIENENIIEGEISLGALSAEVAKRNAETVIKIKENQAKQEQKITKEKEQKIRAIVSAGQSVLNLVYASANQRVRNQYNKRFSDLEKQLNGGQISEEEYAQKKEQLERNQAKKLHKIAVEQFKVNRAITAAGIIADTAKSVMAAIAASWPTFGMPWAAINAATGALQLSLVLNQKPPAAPSFAEGGAVIKGKSHAEGGEDIYVGGQLVGNMQGDEGIFVTKKEATNPALQMLNEANTRNGGRSMFDESVRFAQDGGEIAQEGQEDRIRQIVAEMMAGAKAPVVLVKSIMAGINAEAEAQEIGVV